MSTYSATTRTFFFSLCLLLAAPFGQAAERPNIKILATGGTIAGAADSATSASYTSGQVGIQTMLNAVPQVKDLANVSGEQVANVGSQDMSINIWLTLAERVNALLKQDEVDGIVITHGTDTQEETAYFLSLVVNSDKPVVTTGAMRSSTSISAEGPLNLYNAIAVAADPKASGVMVVLNDRIHDPRDVTKMNTTNVDAFQSPIKGAMGDVLYGDARMFRQPATRHTSGSEFRVSADTELPRVDVLYAYADMIPDHIEFAVKQGAKGIVIAGMGNGNVNAATREKIKWATDKGIAVVRSARVPTGVVIRNGEINDDELGSVASGDLNPQKSRILLMLCLLAGKSTTEIQAAFNSY